MNSGVPMNRVRTLILVGVTALCAITSRAIVIQAGQRIQVIGNGAVLFSDPKIINELPDISVPSANSSDSVLFSNGDFVYGKLVGIGAQRDIRW